MEVQFGRYQKKNIAEVIYGQKFLMSYSSFLKSVPCCAQHPAAHGRACFSNMKNHKQISVHTYIERPLTNTCKMQKCHSSSFFPNTASFVHAFFPNFEPNQQTKQAYNLKCCNLFISTEPQKDKQQYRIQGFQSRSTLKKPITLIFCSIYFNFLIYYSNF